MKINMEKTFLRVRSVKDITIISTLIILGSLLIALPTSTAVNITGFFMIFAGIILAFVLKTGYKESETGQMYMKKERYFQHAMNAEIAAAISSKPDSLNLSEEDKGNALRLDIYFSRSANKAYIQMHEYVPYKYEPCSRMYEYEIANVKKLIG